MTTDGLKLIVAHGSDDVLRSIADLLDGRHHIQESCGTIIGLKQAVARSRPDLIVSGLVFPDGDGIDAVVELGRENPIPSVIVTASGSPGYVEKAMEDHVMAYLIEPVSAETLEAAIIVSWSRFQQLEELSHQVDDLRQALEQRKVVERAKGILMANDGLSEGEAFAKLRRAAQDRRTKMIAVAKEVIGETEQGNSPT